MRSSVAIVASALLFGITGNARSCRNDLHIRINDGLIRGVADEATPDVRQFLGIPYGRPPLGDLRFAPPQPALPFGELFANELPPSCMQHTISTPRINTQDVLEFNLGGLNGTTGPISEDCLTLSIWTPRVERNASLPVLLFFYGGAFFDGGTNVPYQLPAQWVQRTKDHIVITFNHRGGIFGYPNAAGLPLEEQNIGLMDQRLAIEWVRDNIKAFGGDPERIGIFGESSGGCAIAYYSYSYREDPIVNSLIMQSGNEFIDILTRDDAHANFTFVSSQVGCGDLGPAEELACMRKVDATIIMAFMKEYSDAGKVPILTFSPIIDERTIFENYTTQAEAGKIAKLPSLVGSNVHDGVSFVSYNPNDSDLELAELTTMSFFFCPSYQSGRVRIAANTGPVYRYLYGGNFTNIGPRGWMGAYHGSHLPLLFGTHPLYRGNSTQLEYETSHIMQDSWVSFVATAGKSMPVKGWDTWDKVDGGQLVEFGNGVPAKLLDSREMEHTWCMQAQG